MRFDIANLSVIAPEESQADEVCSATADDLERFIRAGGKIDLNSWSQLNEFSKDCLVAASHELRIEAIYMIGKAMEEYGPEKVWAMMDEGELFKDKVAEDMADAAAINVAGSINNESVSNSPTNTPPA